MTPPSNVTALYHELSQHLRGDRVTLIFPLSQELATGKSGFKNPMTGAD